MAKQARSDTDQQIGLRIRAARMARGMSQEKLGEALGITFQQIQKYEKGTNRTSVSALLKIAKALEVTAADLVPELKGTGTERLPPAIVCRQALEAARLVEGLRVPQHRTAIVGMIRSFAEHTVEPLTSAGEAQAA